MTQKYLKTAIGMLPLSEAGQLSVNVTLSLRELLAQNTLATVRAANQAQGLSERNLLQNLGCSLLKSVTNIDGLMFDAESELNITVTDAGGSNISLAVSGVLAADTIPKDLVTEEEPPLQSFTVDVCRIGYGHLQFSVTARTAAEAVEQVDAKAGSYVFSEHDADYVFDVQGKSAY